MELNIDTTKYSVEELREMLIKQYNIPQNEVEQIKGKSNLVNFLHSVQGAVTKEVSPAGWTPIASEENVFESAEFEIIDDGRMIEFDQKLNRSSPGWSSYVLSQLGLDEKDTGPKGNDIPRTDGLKRLVEELIGPIIEIDNTIVQAPTLENGMVAAVRSKIVVLLETGATMSYTACADCVKSECPFPYNKFMTAIAETRAEGRVYRKLLALKNTTTFEEIIGTDKEEDVNLDDKITSQQIQFVDMMCNNTRGFNISVQDLLHKVTNKQYNKIQQYTTQDGLEVSSVLNTIQKDSAARPEGLGGYDPNWRDYFSVKSN